jgi:hypothetical protein
MRQKHGEPTGMFYYHVRSDKLVPVKRTEKDVDFLAEELDAVADILREGKFPRRMGLHCNWCDYKEPCLGDSADRYQYPATPQAYEQEFEQLWRPARHTS